MHSKDTPDAECRTSVNHIRSGPIYYQASRFILNNGVAGIFSTNYILKGLFMKHFKFQAY